MPRLRKSSKPTKEVPAHTRDQGMTDVSGYTARNPSFFRRKTINMSGRPAKVYEDKQGRKVIDLPPTLYNQVVSGVKDPITAFQEAGVEDWEYTSGELLVGNTKNRTKVPIELPRTVSD